MSLLRAYSLLRAAGYITGLIGLFLVMMARSAGSQSYLSAGFLLITIAFGCLFVTYVLYMISRFRRGPS